MMQRVSVLVAVAGLTAVASASINDYNGLHMRYRNFNDYPGSTINAAVTANSARIVESMGPGQQKFANRHFAMLSGDGGASALTLKNNESFKVSYKFRLSSNIDDDGSGLLWNQQPEAGLWFFNNDTGSEYDDDGGIFTVGNGTVFVGGSNQKFSLIGEANNGTGAWSKGDTVDVGYTYYAPGVTGALAAYVVQWNNLTTGQSKTVFNTFDPGDATRNGFKDGATLGFRFQHTRNPLVPGGTIHDTEYYDINVVPTSSSLAALALGGLVAARRRRA